jgi:hypothetical protein
VLDGENATKKQKKAGQGSGEAVPNAEDGGNCEFKFCCYLYVPV